MQFVVLFKKFITAQKANIAGKADFPKISFTGSWQCNIWMFLVTAPLSPRISFTFTSEPHTEQALEASGRKLFYRGGFNLQD